MLLKRLSDSILHFPSISEVSDNSNRLYNLDGVLYFNGVELGSGDVENVWVNSNDFATYTTVTANLYDTWVTLNTSIDLLNGNSNVSVEDLVVGLEGANTNIDTVQANLSAQFNETSPGQIPAINSSNTGFINSGIIYNANTSSLGVGVSSAEDIEARLHIVGTGTANTREVLFKVNNSNDHDRIEFIDESSADSLPSALRNRLASYGLGIIAESGPVRLYSGGSAANNEILEAQASGVTFHNAYTFPTADGTNNQVLATDGNGVVSFTTLFDSSANDYNTWKTVNTAIDTIQANLTLDNASLTANTYNTYTTLNTAIDTVQANLTADNASLTANTYNTWKTVNTAIDTIQANISLNVISDAITPSSDDAGYVGNTSRTWASGHFTDFEIDSSLQVGGSVTIEGNLTVTGNTVTVNASELAIEDNMIYLNANNAVTNPDLGIAGNYNDGGYAHAGFFRDASDGRWKVYEGYLPEPDASPYIDTSNSSFSLAAFQAGNIYAAAVEVNEVDILANLYNTYDILTANVYNTYIAIVGSDGVTTSQVVANLYNTWVSVNTNLDVIQANVTADNASLTANTYNTYTTLNTAIDTIQANLNLDNASLTANTYNTYTTLNTAIDTVQANLTTDTANLYNTWKTVNTAIDTVQANVTADKASLTANTYNTYTTLNTAIDTVQANLTTDTANLYNTWKTVNTAIDTVQANVTADNASLTANTYNTYTTLNSSINTVQDNVLINTANLYNTWKTVNTAIDTVNANVAFDNPDLILPSANLTGVVGNVAKTYSSGHFNSLNVVSTIYSDKILYSNMYSNEVDLPSATDYHGMFAHVHTTGAGYFSHNGNWIKLVDNTTPTIAASTALVAGATTNPSTSTLHVTGNAYISSDILIGGTLTETSTIKIKENIVPLNNQLDKLMLLRPVEYDKINSRSHEYGLIAEEVANVLPEAVSSGNSAIQYTRLIPTLIKAVQELKQEVQELRNGST